MTPRLEENKTSRAVWALVIVVLIGFWWWKTDNPMAKILRTKFQFYGVVLDTNGDPVPDAKVEGSIMNSLVKGKPFQTTSDASGRFKISSRGAALYVEVSKHGYYKLDREQSAEPSKQGADLILDPENGLSQTSSASPAVFRLRKAGNPIELQRLAARPKIPRDGRSVDVELSKEANLVMEVSCLTLDGEERPDHRYYDWRCGFTVKGGEIQEMDDNLAFVAPIDGYEESALIDMPRTLDPSRWRYDVAKNYWIRFSDRSYGRIQFRMLAAGAHYAVIQGFRNPTPNDTNLEPLLGTPDPIQNRLVP